MDSSVAKCHTVIRAVRIELFTTRVLCWAAYQVLEYYSTDTGSSY